MRVSTSQGTGFTGGLPSHYADRSAQHSHYAAHITFSLCAGQRARAMVTELTRKPAACGPVLYLDFDGVLHHENVLWSKSRGPYLEAPQPHKLFEHALLLEKLIEPFPDVAIVLSTSWVVRYGCYGAARRLPASLRKRVIGATFHSQMNRADFDDAYRGMQVWSDVYRRQPSNWMAIDDDYLQWPAWCREQLVRSHPERGINDPSVIAQISDGLLRISRASLIKAPLPYS